MKDLTTTEMNLISGKIKSFLDITWNDDNTNTEVADMVTSCVSFINKTAGVELDYFKAPRKVSDDVSIQSLFEDMCHQGEELLKNRCFYYREKALEDFKKNYVSDINDLFIAGSIYKSKVKEDDK